jgi:hypothetical protein
MQHGPEMRAHENITEVRHGGWSANMALRRAYREVDRQVRHRDDHRLLGDANIGKVLISHGSINQSFGDDVFRQETGD